MIHVIRVLFLALVSAVALSYTMRTVNTMEGNSNPVVYYVMLGSVVVAFAIITFDLLAKRKNLTVLSGLFFGLLVGASISLCLSYLLRQVVDILLVRPTVNLTGDDLITAQTFNENLKSLMQGINLLLGLMITYVTVSFILQTKDDFRFIIPYTEFTRATKGPRPLILDTSVIIDGRIADVAATGVFESRILVPRFVLTELQAVADSGDRLKRSRGRRGLDVLAKLQANPKLELHIWDGSLLALPDTEGVDQKLVAMAQQENGRIVTNDFNLNKIAQLRGVDVVNINSLAEAVKPVVLPGETMRVRVVKPGEGQGQGVGYLEDGTMVVVEGAREKVGTEVDIVVTNALQTAAGKMIFGRIDGAQATLAASATSPKAPPRKTTGEGAA